MQRCPSLSQLELLPPGLGRTPPLCEVQLERTERMGLTCILLQEIPHKCYIQKETSGIIPQDGGCYETFENSNKWIATL